MARRTDRPLTTAEAKERLRLAAEVHTPGYWISHNTGKALLWAVVGGVLLGSAPNLRRNLSRIALAALPVWLARR